MDTLEQLLDYSLDMAVVKARYGGGFVCFISDTETTELLSDTITGGDSEWACTLHLEKTWFPYVTAATINEAIQALANKVTAGVEKVGLPQYATACNVACGKMLEADNLYNVPSWKVDVVDFLEEWSK